ncbi:hypothetical protein LCGC14_1963500, partial [marine sediment metagenome]
GYVRWTEGRNVGHFVDMIASGAINVAGLITHRLPVEQAPQIYEQLLDPEDRYAATGIVFLYDPAGEATRGPDGR